MPITDFNTVHPKETDIPSEIDVFNRPEEASAHGQPIQGQENLLQTAETQQEAERLVSPLGVFNT